jgi:hypothetical protein
MKTFISLVIAIALLDSSAAFAASSHRVRGNSASENATTAQLNQEQLSQPQAQMPQYDGNWVLTAPGAGGRLTGTSGGVEQACSDFRLPFQIRNNQIVGNATRSNDLSTEIVASPNGAPITGTVQPDGTFNVQWERFNITGKITGNTLVANWTGQCGPRSATGTRVGS